MNAGVILKVCYNLPGEINFTELDVIPFSGTFTEQSEIKEAGILFSAVANFKIAGILPETDILLKSLLGRRATFKITDANDTVFWVGDALYRARFLFEKRVDGTPGSFNGYQCSITRTAPTACPTE